MIHKCRPMNDNNPRGCLKDDGTCKEFYHAMKVKHHFLIVEDFQNIKENLLI